MIIHRSSPDSRRGAATVTIRIAQSADRAALLRLAQLDSVSPSRREELGTLDGVDRPPTLIAEVDGEMHAAFPLDGGPAIADPFERTAELVALLRARATELLSPTPEPSRSASILPSPTWPRHPATTDPT